MSTVISKNEEAGSMDWQKSAPSRSVQLRRHTIKACILLRLSD